MASHWLLQQNASWLHTSAQQSASAQNGIEEAVQQSLVAIPHPEPPQPVHQAVASFAHCRSQEVLQQNGSREHTNWQHGELPQPGVLDT